MSSTQPLNKGICSMCWGKDGKKDMVLLKCIDCSALFHDVCYGRVTTWDKTIVRRHWDKLQCWACMRVGKTVKGRTRNGVKMTVTVDQRPTECCLCSVDLPLDVAPLPMHPLYDFHGKTGRQLILTQKTKKYPFPRAAWVHSLCAFVVNSYYYTKGCVFGCDKMGKYEGENDEPGAEDDRSVNSELGNAAEEDEDEQVEESSDGTTLTPRLKRELSEGIHHHVFCLGANAWTKQIKWHQKNLRCIECSSFDPERKDYETFQIPIRCCANRKPEEEDEEAEDDDVEHEEFQGTHPDNEPCCMAMHVGCAMWGQRAKTGGWPRNRRIFYYPAPPGQKKAIKVVANIFCNAHAEDLQKAGIDGAGFLRYPGPGEIEPPTVTIAASERTAAPSRSFPAIQKSGTRSTIQKMKNDVPKARRSAPINPVLVVKGPSKGVKRARDVSDADHTSSVSHRPGKQIRVVPGLKPPAFSSRTSSGSGGRPNLLPVTSRKTMETSAQAVGDVHESKTQTTASVTHAVESSSTSNNEILQKITWDVKRALLEAGEGESNNVMEGRRKYWLRIASTASATFRELWKEVVASVAADDDQNSYMVKAVLSDLEEAVSGVDSGDRKRELVKHTKEIWRNRIPADKFKSVWREVKGELGRSHRAEETSEADKQKKGVDSNDEEDESCDRGRERAGSVEGAGSSNLQSVYSDLRRAVFSTLGAQKQLNKQKAAFRLIGIKPSLRRESGLSAEKFSALWDQIESEVGETFFKSDGVENDVGMLSGSGSIASSRVSDDIGEAVAEESDELRGHESDTADLMFDEFYDEMLRGVGREIKKVDGGRAIPNDLWQALKQSWAKKAKNRFPDLQNFDSVWMRIQDAAKEERLAEPVDWSYLYTERIFDPAKLDMKHWDAVEVVRRDEG